jgi:hypothetical protein
MNELTLIKRHLDRHDIAGVIVENYVAINMVWTSHTVSGAIRQREYIERVTTLDEARRVIGCDCLADDCGAQKRAA